MQLDRDPHLAEEGVASRIQAAKSALAESSESVVVLELDNSGSVSDLRSQVGAIWESRFGSGGKWELGLS